MSFVIEDGKRTLMDALHAYSAELASLRADMSATQSKVEALTASLEAIIELAGTAGEPVAQAEDASAEVAIADPAPAPIETADAADETATDIDAAPAQTAPGDDLTLIAGIDTAAAETLTGFGITSFDTLAQLAADEAEAIGMILGDAGRISRESWIDQASVLATGGLTAYARIRLQDTGEIEGITSGTAAADDATSTEATQTDVAAEIETATPLAVIEPAAAADPVAPSTAMIVSIADVRKAPRARKRRPLAIAASLAMLLATGISLGMSVDQLGVNLAAVTTCGEALIIGDGTCVGLSSSMF